MAHFQVFFNSKRGQKSDMQKPTEKSDTLPIDDTRLARIVFLDPVVVPQVYRGLSLAFAPNAVPK